MVNINSFTGYKIGSSGFLLEFYGEKCFRYEENPRLLVEKTGHGDVSDSESIIGRE